MGTVGVACSCAGLSERGGCGRRDWIQVMSLLGDVLKERREVTGLGLREAAKQAGISPATFSRIEEGGDDMDVSTFARLCHWLGLSPAMFLSKNGLK